MNTGPLALGEVSGFPHWSINQSLKAAFYMDKEIMFKPIVISSGPGNRLRIWNREEKLSSLEVVIMNVFKLILTTCRSQCSVPIGLILYRERAS